MNFESISRKFRQLGARVKFRPLLSKRWVNLAGKVQIDIARDQRGEFFDVRLAGDADLLVLDVQPSVRHLLLMSREPAPRRGMPDLKDKFLCGHDERHWFVAGVPESTPVSSVVTAKEALKPRLIRDLEAGLRGKLKNRQGRKTETFLRQGEWFFIPAPAIVFPDHHVLRDEPLRRGRGKPHHCQFLYRLGGTAVYFNHQFPNGLTEAERATLFATNPAAVRWQWRSMRRDPQVFVRGQVRHADHATITLDLWHRVLLNSEAESRAQASVAFLD